jgi:AGZA family xanthine/uracil permease-like MFS transporter
MMRRVNKIDWENEQEAIPAFVTIVLMPFGYSIFLGLFGGIVTWCIMAIPDLVAGKKVGATGKEPQTVTIGEDEKPSTA